MQTKKQTIIRLPNVRRLLELLTGDHPRVLAVSAPKSQPLREHRSYAERTEASQ